MIRDWRTHLAALLLAGVAGLIWLPVPRADAYVEASHSLGQVVSLSSNIVLMKVTAIDRKDNRIIYAKVRDIKGVHKQQEIRHQIGKAGFEPREWQNVMNWADIGKEALFFHNGSQSETCLGMYWYQTDGNANDPNAWWRMTHGEPFLLRSFAGRLDKLVSAAADIHAGKEVIVPCMVDGNKDDLKAGKAKIQRLRASLKLANYDQKRDFVGWGGEDFRRLSGMPGFTHISSLPRVDPDAQSISTLDFDNDGKPDICLAGAGRVALLKNGGESLGEVSLPGQTRVPRAAVWADYNGDGLADLLLATPAGPRLYTNLGKGEFRDDSHLLPREPGYNLTCAAWIDQDGDGRPDVLLGNGWHGLRLYRNKGKSDHKGDVHLEAWHVIGPFPNDGNKGFDTAYPPEKEIDLAKKYPGKGGEAAWKEASFADGKVNDLAALFPVKEHAVAYLHREITCKAATKLPLSLGSDDGLAVWLNGKKVVSVNQARSCVPDSTKVTLDLKPGKNDLLLKVTQTTAAWEFYFKPVGLPPAITWAFEDVSDAAGLGERGIGSAEKGDSLTVGDFDGDGKQDFIYGAGSAVVVRNDGSKFVEVKDSGIAFETGRVGPVLGDFDADGRPDLFVPQKEGCKLFKNNGGFKFADVTDKAGLAGITGRVTCAAWGDVDNDGKVDLVIGRLRATNLFLRNKGDGTFEDASARLGLEQRVFNTQAVCLVDLNNDGVLDMVFNNEGQDSAVLLGNPEVMAKRTPVSLQLAGKLGVTGSRVRVTDTKGTLCGSHAVSGGEGRGGQPWPVARFALEPGTYRVEVLFSGGQRRRANSSSRATTSGACWTRRRRRWSDEDGMDAAVLFSRDATRRAGDTRAPRCVAAKRWGALSLLLLASAALADPTYRGDPRRTGNGDGKDGPTAGKVLWAMKAKEHFIAAPVAHKDRLYVSGLSFINGSVFYAIDTVADAKRRVDWSKKAPLLELPTVSTPAVVGDTLIFGDGMHQTNGASVYGLDQATGTPRWQYKVEGTLVHLEGSPTVAGGKVYLGGGAAGVLCIDPAKLSLDGKEMTPSAIAKLIEAKRAELLKKYEEARAKKDKFAVPPTDQDLPRAAPALAWQAGKDKWHVDAPVAVVGDKVLVASAFLDKEKVGNRGLFCLDAATGKEKWTARLLVNPWGGPSVSGQTVVVTGSSIGYDPAALKGARGAVAAFDLETGKQKWKKELAAGVVSCAALNQDSAVVTCTDGKVRAYNLATGALRWTYTGGAAFFAPPAISADTAYVADLAGVVHAVNLKSGGGRWKLDLAADKLVDSPGMVYGGPLIHGGRLYVVTCNLAGANVNKPTAVVCIGDK